MHCDPSARTVLAEMFLPPAKYGGRGSFRKYREVPKSPEQNDNLF